MPTNVTAAKETLAKLTFGAEFEVIFAGTRQQLAAAIRAAGVDARDAGYTHDVTSYWKVVHDGSVSGGCEVVSPILTLDRIEEVQKVCDALAGAGATVNRSCGFHVHVGAREVFTEKQIRNIAKRFVRYEAAMDTMVAPSRRNNPYCRPFTAGSVSDVNGKMAAIDRAANLREVHAMVFESRYRKLNLECFWRQGTVEFRQHGGTVDAEKAIRWIKFCMAFCARAAFGPNMTAVRKVEDAKALRSRLLVSLFGKNETAEDAAAIRFFTKRARLLNNEREAA